MTNTPLVWADPDRERAFTLWFDALAPAQGLLPDTLRPASADASFRRYFRVGRAGGGDRIIMDAPPDREDSRPFVKVAALMTDAGLQSPRVLAWDEAQGFMLLSDLGAQTMLQVIDQAPEADRAQRAYGLYREAVDALVTWQLASKPGVLPPCDDALLSRELALFPDWYVEKHRGITIDGTLRGKLDALFAQIKDSNLNALGGARVYVHRDFMPRNLMVAQDGTPALGILDFQDAVYGPITYDIASLMRDAFISWPEDFVLEISVRYWEQARKAGLPVGEDFGEFYRAVEWMGLQRHLKILGIFARLTLRDGKPAYLADTPRFIAYARATCARYRQLGPLMVLLDEIEGNETRVGYTF
jgi:aminoglycoside/choline kinase family phosphotransferase